MDAKRTSQSDSKDTIKNVSDTPRVGRRTLMLEFMKTIQETRQGHSTIEFLPPLTEQDYGQIHYTQRYINPTFSNYTGMNVFETYFAVKYTFMHVTDLPPIRVFKADGQLWSVDNRRLWIMKQANKFHCDGPFTREQGPTYFNELVIKRRSLRGGTGLHVQFHSDASYICCITAFNQGTLDTHIAEVHLKTSLESIRFLAAKNSNFDKLIIEEGSLNFRVRERCQLLKRIMSNLHFPPSEKVHQLFLAFP